MQVGPDLIDGANDGYTGAPYCNSAYRAKGYTNNAEMLQTGTIRVMKSNTIQEGDEILFAYHECYWRRWGEGPKQRGRKRRPTPASTTTPYMNTSHSGSSAQSSAQSNSSVKKRRGRPPQTVPNPEKFRQRPLKRRMRWTSQGRDEFLSTVQVAGPSVSDVQTGQAVQCRFERGEGGGVT